MKRSCKHIDIEDPKVIEPWVFNCIERHFKRRDFKRLLLTLGGLSREEYLSAVYEQDKTPLFAAAERIAEEAAKRIRARKLGLPPVKIRKMIDKSSGKVRQIGKESAMQQVFDYVAVFACEEIWNRRVVPQQVSSIKGKGQVFGVNMIQGWVESDNRAARYASRHGLKYSRKCRYYVKLDITKCFPSMRLETFMKFFKRDCGSRAVLWLWGELLRSHRVQGYEGFMIGALPSQWACQYLLSYLFRFAMELHKERRGKRTKLITHALYFMDDQIYFGRSRRDLKLAVGKIIRYAESELGLEIKPDWQIYELDKTPLDSMGFLIHADGAVTVRPRVFIRARRMALRVLRRAEISIEQARRICAYKGYFRPKKRALNLSSRKADKKYRLAEVFARAAAAVSKFERRKHHESTVFTEARKNSVYAAP